MKYLLFLIIPWLSFSQDTLQVAVYDSPPFGIKSNSGEVEGLMVELWEDIAKDLDLHYEYHVTDMNTLLTGLNNKTFDVGLGAISITPQREKLVDFTQPVNPSGTGIAVSKSHISESALQKWMPIFINLLELIILLLLMLLVSAIIVFLIEKHYAKGEHTERNIETIADGLWWSAVTMTTVGYGDKVPRSKAGKILGIIWIFTSIIFFSLFTANASAQLFHSKTKSNINSIQDLRNVRVTAVANSSGAEFLKRELIEYIPQTTLNNAIEAVLSGKADAVVSNLPVLKYHNRIHHNEALMLSEAYLVRNNMGIALKDESPLKEQIDLILLQKITEPKWQQAVYKYIGE
ncbi:transporter substrate-binding domain-containing protein [Winogradskyella sp.]|uniref:transporter substrate-binding domain-containing protein n=1 Tax=Winogradskyella sp. TaxID=1883156 RepID=UPI002617204D|nr:transporter substrate-binding domain-containing protein [Winogradskyella sp.]